MKYIIAGLITLALIVGMAAALIWAAVRIYRAIRKKRAKWEVHYKELPNGKTSLWIQRDWVTDLYTTVNTDEAAVFYEYDRLQDACYARNATRKILHL